ncbi:1,4-alpha-glucan branching protein GlgB [Rhodoplanes sp. SY1]|uniref:1,4-alpha-glucan branching protein GlgB n=1 Tax=Rhodoplanes sp. SY1 TaxID=3166646 RepID=UPI0038B5EBE0
MTEVVTPEAHAIIGGYHADPFRYLGPHVDHGQPIVRVYLPGARQVRVRYPDGQEAELKRLHDAGLFSGLVPSNGRDYRLLATWGKGEAITLDDPYRFGPVFSDLDLYLMGEGTHLQIYDRLGAHTMMHEGVQGVAFGVFAPNARRVSVVGDFNFWDGRRHAMRVRGNGFWEIFIPDAKSGDKYKYEIVGPHSSSPLLKADPYAFSAEVRPLTASVIVDPASLPQITPGPAGINRHDAPISIYEVHLGSWRRNPYLNNSWLTYRELAEQLPQYVADMGFTHIELLPIAEHPFDASWGYQPTGLYAPTSRFGTPHDFACMVDAFHKHGVGVILDWVPGHFPDDAHGLAQFDGTALYEHANAMQGRHLDWNTLIYNFGRREVANFLVANALFWMERYKIDGLRVDAVASMLYLDYSRPEGGWIPNKYGGRENLEAIDLLRRFNTEVFGNFPNATTMAEESTAWPMVSRPADIGGLGFGFKWNMGWMHDTLRYMSKDPIYRKHHHGDVTFGMLYAFFENFVLPLSHDEVVHGKGSIFGRMPGDRWQKFANLRAYYTFMYGHPGKKLLFMGGEFAQEREWQHDHSLDWHLLEDKHHAGVQSLIRDLNRLYKTLPALHQLDAEPGGFEWLVVDDADNSVFAWLRRGRDPGSVCLVAVNFTPAPRENYRLRVPFGGGWREVFNSDAEIYGGGNIGNGGRIQAEDTDHGAVLNLVLPPLAGIVLVPEA